MKVTTLCAELIILLSKFCDFKRAYPLKQGPSENMVEHEHFKSEFILTYKQKLLCIKFTLNLKTNESSEELHHFEEIGHLKLLSFKINTEEHQTYFKTSCFG